MRDAKLSGYWGKQPARQGRPVDGYVAASRCRSLSPHVEGAVPAQFVRRVGAPEKSCDFRFSLGA